MIFSKGGATPVSPSVKPTHRRRASSSLNVVETFRAVEDDVDAAPPVDAQNAPTGVWKSRREREIPTAPTSILFCLTEEEKKEETKKISSNQLSTKSDQIQGRTRRGFEIPIRIVVERNGVL